MVSMLTPEQHTYTTTSITRVMEPLGFQVHAYQNMTVKGTLLSLPPQITTIMPDDTVTTPADLTDGLHLISLDSPPTMKLACSVPSSGSTALA